MQQQLTEIGNPDSTTVFKQHVFTLLLTIVPGGGLARMKTKLRLPRVSRLYRHCKLYRVALIVREATRRIPQNHEGFTPGDKKITLGI